MLRGTLLKGIGTLTLFFFMFFLFAPDFLSAQKEEDVLLKARKLYQQGDYEKSIKMLSDFIGKLRAMVEQKKNVAEAFYLLAKIYYEVGDDAKVDENLTRCFDTFPSFAMDESNLGFKDRVDKIKREVLEGKTRMASEEEKPTVEPKEYPVQKRMVEQPSPIKKKKKFPVLLVVGGIVVVGTILALTMGKKKKADEVFDIRGNWTITENYPDGTSGNQYLTFSGSIQSGDFVDRDNFSGKYSVSGRTVNFYYNDSAWFNYTGNFVDQSHMSGNWNWVYQGSPVSGTWTAARGFTNISVNNKSCTLSQTLKKGLK